MASDKRALRKVIRQRLADLTDPYLKTMSQEISSNLAEWLEERPEINKIALYSALPSEVNLETTTQLLPKKEWHYPVVRKRAMSFHRVSDLRTLQKGFSEIYEPNPMVHPPIIDSELDLIICPGLGFTEQGYRLGRGGGFYDRFLATIPNTPRMGACFIDQIQESLPSESYDISMTHLLTPNGVTKINTDKIA